MAAFTAKDVQALREKTGVGMMECKKALVEAEGDMDKAVEILKERGLATQQKKSSRVAAEGVVVAYNDKENKVGVLVEVNCETDFVAKNPDFVALANKIAKTVAEKNPADVDALLQETLTGADCTVEAAVQELFLAIRENMKVRRFARVEGVVETYIHAGGAVGVMVQFETDDATAAKDEFAAMGKNVAMQVAAMSPEYLSESDITPDELAKMKNITVESALNKPESLPKPLLKKVFEKVLAENHWTAEDVAAYEEQKNNKFLFNFLSKEGIAKLAEVAVALKDQFVNDVIFGKAVEGRVNKQIKEICLLNQAFVRTDLFDGNVGGYVANVAKQLGADIKVTGFTRFQRGEGIEKKADNFAAEIASMVK